MSEQPDNLVTRLRIEQHERTAVGDGYLFGEAADEIERLRAKVDYYARRVLNDDPAEMEYEPFVTKSGGVSGE